MLPARLAMFGRCELSRGPVLFFFGREPPSFESPSRVLRIHRFCGRMSVFVLENQGVSSLRSERPKFVRSDQSSFGAEQSSFGAEQSSFGAEQSSFGAEQSSFGAEQRSFGAEQSSFGAEQRSFGAEQRSFGAEQRSFGAEQSSFGAEQSSFGAEQSSFGAAQPAIGAGGTESPHVHWTSPRPGSTCC